MIRGGKGGSKTLTGLEFERRVNLRDIFAKLPGYQLKGNELYYDGKLVAKFFKKYELYSKLLNKFKIYGKERISKLLLPDETILVMNKKTLFIIEMKFQHVAGSVDEKLQTCDFKKKQYSKLFRGSGLKVEYVYILSDWFKKKEYEDTRKYIKSVGCEFFFEELPFKFLGLPEPKLK